MGCDIHAYLEYGEGRFFGDVSLGRDYALFGMLTDGTVRSPNGPACAPAPRGLPDDVSWDVSRAYYIRVEPDADGDLAPEDGERAVCYSNAIRYARYGAHFAERRRGKIRRLHGTPGPSARVLVSNPDWHTASWLSSEEFDRVIQAYESLRDYFYVTVRLDADGPPEGPSFVPSGRGTWHRVGWHDAFVPKTPGPTLESEDEVALMMLYTGAPERVARDAMLRLHAEGRVTMAAWAAQDEPRVADPSVRAAAAALRELPEGRIVFWFDN